MMAPRLACGHGDGGAIFGRDDRHIGCSQFPDVKSASADVRPFSFEGAPHMLESIGVRELPSSGSTLVLISCPDCGQGQLARVLIWDEDGDPAMFCCLSCEAFFRAEDVSWRAD
jgi:hypothetical protein